MGTIRSLLILALSLHLTLGFAEEKPIQRTVLALFEKQDDPHIWYQNIHQYLEMPLNHLGYKVIYHDVTQSLPDITTLPDVKAILTWFAGSEAIPNPEGYVEWLENAHKKQVKLILFGNPGFGEKGGSKTTALLNRVYRIIGLSLGNDYISQTHNVEFIKKNPRMVGFERGYPDIKPPFQQLIPVDREVESHLVVRNGSDASSEAVLIATGPNGSYSNPEYAIYHYFNGDRETRKWYLNPFYFMMLALDVKESPIPDTTTLAGSRLYYSHIDGDGWNNMAEIDGYQQRGALSAEVILEEIIVPNPDLPVTVAPIGADINLKWVGSPEARLIAKKTLELPQVEAGSHTFTHPFYWRFFSDYRPAKEEPFLDKYTHGSWKSQGVVAAIKGLFSYQESEIDDDITKSDEDQAIAEAIQLKNGYDLPRAFALQPFSINLEIQGSLDEIGTLLPKGKKVTVLQWSGDCQPWAGAIQATREAGVYNINGGDSRFDSKFNSYSWVRPVSAQVGDQLQVYASCSNENTYTDLWTKKFYGFNQLPETMYRTEVPIRIKPMNLYYHMYSGQKAASLEALKQNIEYIRSQDPISVDTSHFAAIVEGFLSVTIKDMGERQWSIGNRGAMQTVRFDRAVLLGVDFSKSKGVVGQRHHQGSLYVYLDTDVKDVVVAVKDLESVHEEPLEDAIYLVESQWQVWDVKPYGNAGLGFKAKGYGNGKMRWRSPKDGDYQVTLNTKGKISRKRVTADGGWLTLSFDDQALEPVSIIIRQTTQAL